MARKKSKEIQERQEGEVRFSIVLDKDLDKWIRIEAVKQDVSRVAYIAQTLQQHRERLEKKGRRELNERYSHIREIQEGIRARMKEKEPVEAGEKAEEDSQGAKIYFDTWQEINEALSAGEPVGMFENESEEGVPAGEVTPDFLEVMKSMGVAPEQFYKG